MAATTKKKPAKQTADAAKTTVAGAKSTASAAKKTAASAAETATSATKDAASAVKDTATAATKSATSATKDAASAAKKTVTSAAKSATSATKSTATALKNTADSAAKAAKTPPTTTHTTTHTTDDHGQQAVKEAIAATRVATPSSFLDTAAAKASEALKSLPTIDFSNFDLDSLKQLDPRKIEWSKLDVSKIEMPDIDRDKVFGAVRDAAYVMVGLGVLAFQQAQVRRRELAEAISDRFGSNRKQMEELIASYEARLTRLDEAIEARVDQAIGMLGERLPDQAETLLYQVNSVAKNARKQMRGMLSSAA